MRVPASSPPCHNAATACCSRSCALLIESARCRLAAWTASVASLALVRAAAARAATQSSVTRSNAEPGLPTILGLVGATRSTRPWRAYVLCARY